MPQAPAIFILRHAEKPTASRRGVDASGRKSPHGLAVKGWQRAGALVAALAPFHGALHHQHLATPAFLFASSSRLTRKKLSKSHRERQTLAPLAHRLNLEINLDFDLNQEPQVADAALKCPGPVLLCWDHQRIIDIARHIPGVHAIPDTWPAKRYDLLYAFHRMPKSAIYTFTQIPLPLLGGDSVTVLPT